MHQLEVQAAILEEALAHFGGIHQCRWIASNIRALNAIKTNYAATCSHLQYIVENVTKDSGRASGLLRKLRSAKFITFLHFMIDLTKVIGPLSLMFQSNDLMLIDVLPIIETAMLNLIDMKNNPGSSISSIVHGFEHKGVFLSGPVEPELQELHMKLVDSAIEQIDNRFKALQEFIFSDFAYCLICFLSFSFISLLA